MLWIWLQELFCRHRWTFFRIYVPLDGPAEDEYICTKCYKFKYKTIAE